MKRLVSTLAVLAAVAFTGTAASAQDEWVRQVRRQLQQAGENIFQQRGYALTHDIYTGSLDEGETTNVTMTLRMGVEYQIMGACDNDCTDLDLTLFDPRGNQVDIDVALDDYPIVSVTPRATGTYRVRVAMADCSAEPCRYGVGVFGK